ncbi:unnamed protein product [Sphagnum tenellum]
MASRFRIGKAGPTILQGDNVPDNTVGLSGDLYVQIGSTPALYIKYTNGWLVSGDPTFGFSRQLVTETGTTSLNSTTTYAGVDVADSVTIELMTGYSGKTVVIKDEGGNAGTYPITVLGQTGDIIDGQTSWTIDINYGSLTLVYGSSNWNIVAAITSAPFNQMKL